MNNHLTYRGYDAQVEFDSEDRIFFGRIANIRDIITFHGTSVDELVTAFEEAVDDYFEVCAELGQTPNLPANIQLVVNVSAEFHHALATAAEQSGLTLGQWTSKTLAQAITTDEPVFA